jgi:hypothetical protein
MQSTREGSAHRCAINRGDPGSAPPSGKTVTTDIRYRPWKHARQLVSQYLIFQVIWYS